MRSRARSEELAAQELGRDREDMKLDAILDFATKNDCPVGPLEPHPLRAAMHPHALAVGAAVVPRRGHRTYDELGVDRCRPVTATHHSSYTAH